MIAGLSARRAPHFDEAAIEVAAREDAGELVLRRAGDDEHRPPPVLRAASTCLGAGTQSQATTSSSTSVENRRHSSSSAASSSSMPSWVRWHQRIFLRREMPPLARWWATTASTTAVPCCAIQRHEGAGLDFLELDDHPVEVEDHGAAGAQAHRAPALGRRARPEFTSAFPLASPSCQRLAAASSSRACFDPAAPVGGLLALPERRVASSASRSGSGRRRKRRRGAAEVDGHQHDAIAGLEAGRSGGRSASSVSGQRRARLGLEPSELRARSCRGSAPASSPPPSARR